MLRATGLRCEYREDTPCIAEPAPRLGWQLESPEAGQRQTGYRVLVEHEGAALWDTGLVGSPCPEAAYAGPALPAGGLCAWRVQVRDREGELSPWSATARFRVAPAGWTAYWIRRDRAYDPPAS